MQSIAIVKALALLLLTAAAVACFLPSAVHADPEPIQLQRGWIANGTVAQQSVDYYVLNGPLPLAQGQTIIFVLSPRSGDADIFISTSPNPTPANAFWSSTSAAGDIIEINATDPHYNVNASYYIGVHGSTDSDYTILAYLSDDIIELFDGEPQLAMRTALNVQRNTYFRFNLTSSVNFTISLTPLYGDADIYVSTVVPRPNPLQANWSAQSFGYDLIDIIPGQPAFTVGSYYITVYAFTKTRFSITVVTANTSANLIESVPTVRDVAKGQFVFFRFDLKRNLSVTFTATSLSANGDPDMYISRTNTHPTSRTNSDFSVSRSGDDTITIRPDMANGGAGWYYIGVHGYAKSTFQILAYTEGVNVALVDGVPQNAQGQNAQYLYYKFYMGDPQSDLDIRATVTSAAGSIRIFVSNSNTQPTDAPGKYDRASDVLSSTALVHFGAPTVAGWYYIGVQHVAAAGASVVNYTISATTNQTAQILQEGRVSYFNYVPRGYYRYFIYDLYDNKDLTISVNPWSGDADLFITTDGTNKPGPNNYMWKARRVGVDSITIAKGDPNYKMGRYYIGVHGFSSSYFSIGAFLAGETVDLLDGIATPGGVTKETYNYYRFYCPHAGSTLTITLKLDLDDPNTDTSADPDLYVSSINPKPNSLDYEYKGVSFGEDTVFINNTRIGYYYIGIHGYSNSSYTITASTGTQYMKTNYQLNDGVAQGQYRYYHVFIPSTAPYIVASVTLVNGRTALAMSPGNVTNPGINNSTFVSKSWPGNTIFISKDDPNFRSGIWSIGVLGDGADADYFIAVSTGQSQLQAGLPILGASPVGTTVSYQFLVRKDFTTGLVPDHIFNLRLINGAVSIDISQGTYTWSYKYSSDFEARLNGTKLSPGILNVTVKATKTIDAANSNSTYSISIAPTDMPAYLTQQQPVIRDIKANEAAYYQATTSIFSASNRLLVVVESCDLNAAPEIYLAQNNSQPGPNTGFDAHSTMLLTNPYIQVLDMENLPPQTRYTIGVHGGTHGATYSLLTTTTQDVRPKPGSLGVFTATSRGKGKFQLNIPGAVSGDPNAFPYTYITYAVELPADWKDDTPYNFYTACAVQRMGYILGNYYVADSSDTNAEFTSEYELDTTKTYMVNVLVRDRNGLEQVYQPIKVAKGYPYPPGPPRKNIIIPIGLLFLILTGIAIVLYIAIGVAINRVKGARGTEALPHIDFWRGLPRLVWDGIRFVFTCGRADVTGRAPSGYAFQPVVNSDI